ncbi:hypothetical protein ALC53_12313 [Atta colombica]|uniref:Uncharacterized protein n=1 Tax=Atta colombica TaxID=520822 RepID=A0A195AZ66_9HYME|nr:hypothetical protein ALC53_12313 [Atta colombica]
MMTQSVALQEDPEGDILTVSPSPDVSYPSFVSLWVAGDADLRVTVLRPRPIRFRPQSQSASPPSRPPNPSKSLASHPTTLRSPVSPSASALTAAADVVSGHNSKSLSRPTCDIYRHAESSVSLFASLANLSGPIPTSRGKKTFDKRPDILAVGPSGFTRGFLNLAESDPCERDEWTLEKVRHRRR